MDINLPIPTKRCTKCGLEKPATPVYFYSHNKHGLQSWCKECIRRNAKRYSDSRQSSIDQARKELHEALMKLLHKRYPSHAGDFKQCIFCKEYYPNTPEFFPVAIRCTSCFQAEKRKMAKALYSSKTALELVGNGETATTTDGRVKL